MKSWIGLAALVAAGCAGSIDNAAAAKVITVARAAPFTPARAQRVYRYDGYGYGYRYGGYGYRAYDASPYAASPYAASRYDHSRYDWSSYGGYYGRPYFYAPAPFPLGFDFGFGW
ncbi:hypothetical protein [uncultured Bradyrhizobium sp.]|uniref:hypothetical protein n=1 Tax=uncultured Bradyrhizobium sp. TaxID=199684 RepID=UPI0035C9AD0C